MICNHPASVVGRFFGCGIVLNGDRPVLAGAFSCVSRLTVSPIAARNTRSRSTAHSAMFGGGKIVFFLLAGAAECPFAFIQANLLRAANLTIAADRS